MERHTPELWKELITSCCFQWGEVAGIQSRKHSWLPYCKFNISNKVFSVFVFNLQSFFPFIGLSDEFPRVEAMRTTAKTFHYLSPSVRHTRTRKYSWAWPWAALNPAAEPCFSMFTRGGCPCTYVMALTLLYMHCAMTWIRSTFWWLPVTVRANSLHHLDSDPNYIHPNVALDHLCLPFITHNKYMRT